QDIFFNRLNQALGQLDVIPLHDMKFPELFMHQKYPLKHLYRDWKSEKRYFRIHQKKQLDGKELAWYKWLYDRGTHKEYLPSVIHIPVKGQHLKKTPPWDWQSRI